MGGAWDLSRGISAALTEPSDDPVLLDIALAVTAQFVHDPGVAAGILEDVHDLFLDGLLVDLAKRVGRLDGRVVAQLWDEGIAVR